MTSLGADNCVRQMPVASIALNTFWRANDLDGTLGMTRDGFCHSAEQVKQLHRDGKAVVANFSDSSEEMDLDAMKSAVAAGVDAINVDYPRLGAEAVGRPVEVFRCGTASLAGSKIHNRR
jgi:hypothetical protein